MLPEVKILWLLKFQLTKTTLRFEEEHSLQNFIYGNEEVTDKDSQQPETGSSEPSSQLRLNLELCPWPT